MQTTIQAAVPSVADIRFRRGITGDAERLALFAKALFNETFGPTNTASDMAQYTDVAFSAAVQERELRDPTRTYLLGESNGELACYALVRPGTADACVQGPAPVEIERFYVSSPWHGSGLAGIMMEHVTELACAAAGRTLWLGVWEFNPRAIRFYEKCGFVDVGSHPFLLGTDMQTDRVMARALP